MTMHEIIPRLELQEMRADLADYLRPRVKRLGYLGELFKCTAHAPDVLLQFMLLTDALKEALPNRLAEVAVLTVARLMSNDYERNQHERLSIRLGFDRNWVSEIERLEPDSAALMTPEELAVQRYVIAAVESRGHACQEEFKALAKRIGSAQAIAMVMLIGRYIAHALIVNTLELAPPVPSIFDDGFTAEIHHD
jgi:alkylhydroperoxidase family enzyme